MARDKSSNPRRSTRSSGVAAISKSSESQQGMKDRRSERAGRPRLDEGDAVLPNDRRAQVRRAQYTYRLKKDEIFRQTTARAEQLEASMNIAAEEVAGLSENATEAQLHIFYPDIYARLERLHKILVNRDGQLESSASVKLTPKPLRGQLPELNTQLSASQQDPHPFPLSVKQYTYAFQESSLARQLQRYCLEYAFRLFVEAGSDPREIYRVFRLVPCVRDRDKTQPRFQQLLMGGRTDPLEVPGLPFYGVGGAGTHFPDFDSEGNAIYPKNSRMPRRILGISSCTDMDTKERAEVLDAFGLGGEWFDSRDVEGYTRQHGVNINDGLFPTLYMPGGEAETNGAHTHVLDIEGFFSREFSIILHFSCA